MFPTMFEAEKSTSLISRRHSETGRKLENKTQHNVDKKDNVIHDYLVCAQLSNKGVCVIQVNL